MSNVVSSKTAEILKADGFPQPEPSPRQVWYMQSVELYIVSIDIDAICIFDGTKEISYVPLHLFPQFLCFAPDAIDILRDFPDGKKYINYNSYSEGFCSNEMFFHKEAAESAAACWMYRKRNP